MPHSQRFEDALVYAYRLHAEQVRKGTSIPYLSHLMSVAALVAEHGGDEDQMIAALLHDAVEDQGGRETLDEIRRRFGDKVAAIVESCTDSFATPKPPWRERKEAYVRHLAEASSEALLISAADKLHNARCIVADLRGEGVSTFARFKGGREGTLWYYGALARELRRRVPKALADELARTVDAMRELGGS